MDDDRRARNELKRLLKARREIEVVGQSMGADEALEAIENLSPDHNATNSRKYTETEIVPDLKLPGELICGLFAACVGANHSLDLQAASGAVSPLVTISAQSPVDRAILVHEKTP